MRIGLYGVSRAGKNCLIKKLQEQVNIRHINGSDMLFELSQLDMPTFKQLPATQKHEWRCRLIQYIEQKYPTDDVIIDGHYSFISDTGYEVVLTELDLNYYDVFMYLDTPANVIVKRMRESEGIRKNETITVQEVEDWKNFEIQELKELCKKANKEFIVLDGETERCIEWIKLTLNNELLTSSEQIASHIIREHQSLINQHQQIMLLDCDKTLSINDSTIDFFEAAGLDSRLLKKTFNGDRYSLYQFHKIAELYSQLDESEYKELCSKISSNHLLLASDLINDLKRQQGCLKIGLTAGIKEVWLNLSRETNFPDIVAGGSYLPNDKYVMSETVKYLVAKKLIEMGKTVIAIGDSLVDLGMLEVATHGYLVSHEKLNQSIVKKLEKGDLKVKQLPHSKVYYDKLEIEKGESK